MDNIYRNLIAYNTQLNILKDAHMEAIKCQVIIERTNILRKIVDNKLDKKGIENIEINNTINEAIDATANLVIMIKDNPIMPYYHICCGGKTENSESVLNVKIDYLRSVTCDECMCSKHYDETDINIECLEKKIGALKCDLKDYDIKGIIEDAKRNESYRVETIKLFNREITGAKLAQILNVDSRRIYFKPCSIKFYTQGNGHGLGFCQIGANEKAKKGWKYDDILKYYYTNTNIQVTNEFDQETPLKGKKIFLDPAHGGEDIGNKSENNIMEKDINLDIALQLGKLLSGYGATVIYSRTSDEDKSLYDRSEFAKNTNPQLLLSIHINKSKFESVSGAEGFFYWGDNESEKISNKILESLKNNTGIKNRGSKEGNFYMLKESGCSAIYLELGYLSNKEEEEKFQDESYKINIATCIADSIKDYYKNKILTL